MKIYTKTGDCGETSLFGGQRVPKNHSRIDAYGTIDELNSVIGVVRTNEPVPKIEMIMERIQSELFVLGADLATPPEKNNRVNRITGDYVDRLERDIDEMESSLQPLNSFILPGGSAGAAWLHMARTVCRRAERACLACRRSEKISDEAIAYLNRLSDLLFVAARYLNHSNGIPDTPWKTP